MRSHLTHMRAFPGGSRLAILFAAAIACIFLLTSCAAKSPDPNSSTISAGDSLSPSESNSVVADGNVPAIMSGNTEVIEDGNGPTILLGYSKEDMKANPISSFMYFVPLISPTLVDRESSAGNEQQTGIISYKRKVTSRSFYVTCDFEILGDGFHMNTFDPVGTIQANTGDLKKGETLANALDYIKLEGAGFGCIEVKGTIAGSTHTVTEVSIQFNARGQRSPVTVGLYDIVPEDGHYKYENRSNELVARVNSLVFRKTEKAPRMGIKVASIARKNKSAGILGALKGALANLLIVPPEVAGIGNETMLNFGLALLRQEPAFTFPKAANIRETGGW